MKAKVKRIKVNTILDVDGHLDSFTKEMLEMARSKKEYEFVSHSSRHPNWFTCVSGEYGWYSFNFHISWLKDVQE